MNSIYIDIYMIIIRVQIQNIGFISSAKGSLLRIHKRLIVNLLYGGPKKCPDLTIGFL